MVVSTGVTVVRLRTQKQPTDGVPYGALNIATSRSLARAPCCGQVGNHQMMSCQFIRWTTPRSIVTSGSLGTMGFGLPAAIGAQIANPDKIVVLVDGDGSFNMTLNDLGTVKEHQLPIKMVRRCIPPPPIANLDAHHLPIKMVHRCARIPPPPDRHPPPLSPPLSHKLPIKMGRPSSASVLAPARAARYYCYPPPLHERSWHVLPRPAYAAPRRHDAPYPPRAREDTCPLYPASPRLTYPTSPRRRRRS